MPTATVTAAQLLTSIQSQLALLTTLLGGSAASDRVAGLVAQWEDIVAGYQAERDRQEARPHPWGVNDDGSPKFGPYSTEFKPMWKHAQNIIGPDGKPLFDYWQFAGGLQFSGDPVNHPPHEGDVVWFEDQVKVLTGDLWAKFWMRYDRNAALIREKAQRSVFGDVVKKNNDDSYSRTPGTPTGEPF